MTPAWEALALVRPGVLAVLRQRYPSLPLPDLEDAVSDAALRVILHGPVTHLRAYWLTTARHALWHQGRHRQVAQGRLAQYARACPLEAQGPAAAGDAAHDLRWYLSRLTPKERARLEAQLRQDYAAYVSQSGERLNTVKVGNTLARRKLLRARSREERP